MSQYTARIQLNAPAAIRGLQLALQRSVDLVSFGLLAAETATGSDIMLPGATFQIAAAGDRRMDFESARAEFRRWILEGGLRDSIEAVGPVLEDVRLQCALASLPAQTTGEEWNTRIYQEGTSFHRLGLPDKIERLAQR